MTHSWEQGPTTFTISPFTGEVIHATPGNHREEATPQNLDLGHDNLIWNHAERTAAHQDGAVGWTRIPNWAGVKQEPTLLGRAAVNKEVILHQIASMEDQIVRLQAREDAGERIGHRISDLRETLHGDGMTRVGAYRRLTIIDGILATGHL